MSDVKDNIDIDNLFRELNDAATEDNDSPLAAVQHIKILYISYSWTCTRKD